MQKQPYVAPTEIHNDLSVPLEFEPLPPDVVAIEKAQRQALLALRNEMDAVHEAAAERGRLERAFNARPVGGTTAGSLP